MTTTKILQLALFGAACLAPCARAGARDDVTWVEVAASNMDVRALSPLAKQALESPLWKWKHAQTAHFVVHYERDIFAAKVARMAEFFYSYIADDLKGAVDRAPGRSHIFVFRNEKDWKTFRARTDSGAAEWAFSFVNGWSMFLQEANDIQSSAEVLGHETTHLVVNRFFTNPLPIWLNEGMAEWYGEFAYSEFKGVKKSKRAQFKVLKTPYPLADLLAADGYPQAVKAVQSFYETSKYLVAFLMLEKPPEKFLPFVTDIGSGVLPQKALQSDYDIADIAALDAEFQKFIK